MSLSNSQYNSFRYFRAKQVLPLEAKDASLRALAVPNYSR